MGLMMSEWTVPVQDTYFGPLLIHGIESDGLFAFAFRNNGGWKLHQSTYLRHQTYVRIANEIIDNVNNKTVREIAVVNLWTGEWATVYDALRRGGGEGE